VPGRDLKRARLAVAVAIAASGLLLAEPAAAHLSADPAFLAVGSTQRIVLTVHNDRDATMTGFRLIVPEGLLIRGTGSDGSWNEAVDGATASWTGGSLAAFRPTTFEVDLEAAGVAPGPVVLRGDQLYADGDSVSWPVTLTVVPPGDVTLVDESDPLGWRAIGILAILGVLALGTFALVFWQRRRESRLQEK
jgi:hypothetical protein